MRRNWFDDQKCRFVDVFAPSGHIKAHPFLEAAKCFTTILNDQTALVFTPVKARFGNNVNQMRETYDELRELIGDKEAGDKPYGDEDKANAEFGGKSLTLDDLIQYEVKLERSDISQTCATRGVVWFTRACQFLMIAFDRSLANPDEPLKTSFNMAYDNTLCYHHDKFVQPLFHKAMTFCPDRDLFYKQLCRDDSMEKTVESGKKYFAEMRIVKDRLVQYCVFRKWDVRYGGKTHEEMRALVQPRKKRNANEEPADMKKQKLT